MNKTLAAALLLAASGCSSESDHGHDHDHEGGHIDPPAAAEPAPTSDMAPVGGTMGPWVVELQPSVDGVRLVAADAAGNAIAPDGDLQLALTSASGETEMITLAPDGVGWSAAATIAPDGAYMAQITSAVGNARLMWGATRTGHVIENPEPASAEDPGHQGHDHGGHDH